MASSQRYVDDEGLADHATTEQAAAMLWELFRRAVLAELELIEVRCTESDA